MYNIAICDDEEIFSSYLHEKLKALLPSYVSEFRIDIYESPSELINALISKSKTYNILFLDIIMEGINGITLAKQIRSLGMNSHIVFVTCSKDYAFSSFEVTPVHYLLKPPNNDSLAEALDRIFEQDKVEDVVIVRSHKQSQNVVVVKEIAYIEIFRTDMNIHLISGNVIHAIGSLREISEQINSSSFYRCQRSYLVNLQYVFSVKRYYFLLKNSCKVPIAKNRYKEAVEKTTEFLMS